ncbi:relaxase domain-containing protein [Georgenia thermotolerans]|uniref:Relaxase domain-containing protein n=2 Tax=Georgenia thermotolerans TaxID=527326 RepID=A0A7J5USU5_9MICO|nr:MobF family relaxase [Georgenia thermotolerans]KAE8765398.1 relaxase domain-containing protein [Georgenia thermotolerans]
MRVMSAGDGYAYLLRSVATGDGLGSRSSTLTRYYAEAGTPPGTWMGSGVAQFGEGELQAGMTVTPEQLQALLGRGCDPLTGTGLGRPYQRYVTVGERIAARVAGVDRKLPAAEYDAEVARIESEETERGPRTSVAGFDLTFSVPKSVSVLWGVADARTQELIVEAHHSAVAQVLDFVEREVAATRVGSGGVAQVDVLGVAAVAYDHWDSRANDPQLHTHLVVANKVRTAADGEWRTLDSRAIHHATVALSEYYNAVLADRLSGTLGIEWQQRARGKDRNPAWEIVGVPDELIAEFSSRSRDIELVKDRLIAEYVRTHGHTPSAATIVRLRAQATLDTRPDKTIHPLANLTEAWRERAQQVLGADPVGWARHLTVSGHARAFTAEQVPTDVIAEAGARVVTAVGERRSTWRHWNLWAEASRQTMGWRFATIEDREAVVAMITDAAAGQSLQLTPPEIATTPALWRRPDGTSMFRPRHGAYFTSEDLLAAEARLLDRAADRTAPRVPAGVVAPAAAVRHDGNMLTTYQAGVLEAVATSGRRVDVIVGPAGAGKTTAMRALRTAWTARHGTGSVVGLAPSAAAAAVLAEDLGIACDNAAKWLYEHARGRAEFRAGQLVIIDEATLAGTRALDRITALAKAAGAKVVLVGDWAQLQSVDAGGAFSLLVDARGDDVPELNEVHRFTNDWEKRGSLELRRGEADVIGTYAAHGRLREGTTAQMIDAAYQAWRADIAAGRTSILVTDSAESVRQLNERARAERIQTGETSAGRDVALADDARASVGDLVITRRNDRTLRTGRTGWVRNGDRWRVIDVRCDGSVHVRRAGRRLGASVVLPAAYVAEHVDLGYAVTAHRAQGLTVDTSHVVVSGSTTRENLYVSMTRGRNANIAYVALDEPDDSHGTPQPADVSARTVLYGVLKHSGLELSAHQTISAEHDRWTGSAQLAAEYDLIAATAERDRWRKLVLGALTVAGRMSEAEAAGAIASDGFGALVAELRRAEANHHDVRTLLPRVVAERSLLDAEDVTAVLSHRVAKAAARPIGSRMRDLIAGLIPKVRGHVPADVRGALDERRDLIEARAQALAETAVRHRAPWVLRIGEPPLGRSDRQRWLRHLAVVAAYRDRYGVTSRNPVGPEAESPAQRHDAQLAVAALRSARAIAGTRTPVVEASLRAGLSLR